MQVKRSSDAPKLIVRAMVGLPGLESRCKSVGLGEAKQIQEACDCRSASCRISPPLTDFSLPPRAHCTRALSSLEYSFVQHAFAFGPLSVKKGRWNMKRHGRHTS